MIRFLTFLLFILIGVLTVFAQQHKVDKEAWDSAIKELKQISTIPLKIPTYFPYKPSLSAKQRRMPIYAGVIASDNTFGLTLCLSEETCHSLYNYAEIYGEKITPQTEKTKFDKTVKLAKGITGYYTESSCGASCASESLTWDQDGYRYTVFLEVNGKVKTIVDFANSAINNDAMSAPATSPSNAEKTIQGGILNGKATFLPKPLYPAKAKTVNARGAVNVEILVDKQGTVIEAKAVSGNALLRESAVSAARQARFKPAKVSGNPVQVKGILIFNFSF